jgi:hypothetical protein
MHLARLAALIVVAACSEWPISARDVPGTYVMNRGRAADTLIVLPHGRYRHIYAMPGQRVVIDSGTWLVNQAPHQVAVRFSTLWARWRNETDGSYLRRSLLTPMSWSVEVSRTLSGRIRMYADENLDWAYVRRGGVPEGRDRPGVRDGDIIFQDRPYDLTFEWSDSRLYCSELVWKAFDRSLGIQIGALQDLGSFDLTDAEVRAQMQKRYGDRVPLEERVISPAAMFAAGNLITVTTR